VNFINSNYGCPKCGRLHAGYAADRIAKIERGLVAPRATKIAFMKIEVFGISAFKLGITSRRLVDRYAFALREVLFEAALDEIDALKLEQHLHDKYFKGRDLRIFLAGLRGGQRWSGDSELYKEEFAQDILRDLNSAVTALQSNDEDYWSRIPKIVAPILKIRTVSKVAGEFNPPKPVVRLDTKMVYPSAAAASRAIGSTPALVAMVCNGIRHPSPP
jgi:hypothetical protein